MSDTTNNFKYLYKLSNGKYVSPASFTNSKEFKPDPLLSKPKPEFQLTLVGVDGNAPRT
jgi:hypothetical protein